jgi:hypothetical protein
VLLRGEALEADGLLSTGSLIDGLADASGRKDVCRWLSLLTAVNPEAGGSSRDVGKPCGTCPFGGDLAVGSDSLRIGAAAYKIEFVELMIGVTDRRIYRNPSGRVA